LNYDKLPKEIKKEELMYKIVLFILIISVFGCAQDHTSTKFTEVTFTIDQILLEEEVLISDLDLHFSPPIGWDAISSEMLENVKQEFTVSQDSTEVKIQPLNIFMNMENSFACFISILDSEFLPHDAVENYLAEFRTSHQDSEYDEGTFSHRNLDFNQIIFQNNEFISIKLISINSNQKAFTIEYVVPIKHYQTELRSIESSIGSINKK
jgi:hypothetical protein